jgi:hypothetical protein
MHRIANEIKRAWNKILMRRIGKRAEPVIIADGVINNRGDAAAGKSGRCFQFCERLKRALDYVRINEKQGYPDKGNYKKDYSARVP